MANALAVGGIKAILNKLNEEVTQAATKASKRDGEDFMVQGRVKVRGNYAFDKDGNLGIVGNAVAKVQAGGDLEATLDSSLGVNWDSLGNGNLEVDFSVKVTRGSAPPQP